MSTPKHRHGQIKNALMKQAREEGMAHNDMYNRFFRELFLAELMTRDDGWVLNLTYAQGPVQLHDTSRQTHVL